MIHLSATAQSFIFSYSFGLGKLQLSKGDLIHVILIKNMFDLFSFFPNWYHDPSLPNSFIGITGSSVHLRPHQRQKRSLSLSLCNPSLAFFDRGNPFQQLCPLSYLLGNPCQTDQIVTTAMRRSLASRLATENSERHTLSSLSLLIFPSLRPSSRTSPLRTVITLPRLVSLTEWTIKDKMWLAL